MNACFYNGWVKENEMRVKERDKITKMPQIDAVIITMTPTDM